MKLRQCVFVCKDLESSREELCDTLGIEVAYRDPGVAKWGLANVVCPTGHDFLEIVSPIQEGTSAGRYIERRKGDGGYMVIIQVADAEAERKRVTGARRPRRRAEGHCRIQVHALPSGRHGGRAAVARHRPLRPPASIPKLWWPPAEKDWLKHARSDVTNGLAGVEIQHDDPDAAAATVVEDPRTGRSRATSSGSTTDGADPLRADRRRSRAGRVGLRRQGRRSRARDRWRPPTSAGRKLGPAPGRGLRLPHQPRMKPLLIVGSYLSPYVRKVLVCLELKGIAYEVDHIVPFFGDDRFSKLSPLAAHPGAGRRRPGADRFLGDLPVPRGPAARRRRCYPADIRDRARARWLEEFADTRMGDVFIWRLFNQIAIRPSVWGEKGDRELVDRNLNEDVPAVLDYLEAEAPADGFRFGALSLADIAIACFFRNAGLVRFQIDAGALAARGRLDGAHAGVAAVRQAGGDRGRRRCARRSPSSATALKALGAPISAETYAGPAPRRGVMPI